MEYVCGGNTLVLEDDLDKYELHRT
jgi:hypothetical protein